VPENLIDLIYEAAFVPELWPSVLDQLSAMAGSIGGAVLTRGQRYPPRWAASEVVAPALHAFAAGDAWKHNKRPERWLAAAHAGFLRDVDLFTADELRGDVMQDAFKTQGLGWQLGTVIPMTTGEVVVFSLERRFDDGTHDLSMRDAVDPFRPHLARAGLLAARLGLERAQNAVATLECMGLPAFVLGLDGTVLAVNPLADALSSVLLPAAHGRLAIADAAANRLLQDAIQGNDHASDGLVRSIPLKAMAGRPPMILHLLPLRGAANDIFSSAAMLLIVTSVSMTDKLPDGVILNALFDLSPSEARLALALASGRTLKQAAADSDIQLSTARSYLEIAFRKTGTHQQSQLVALLKSAQPLRQQLIGSHD
jgi:DNA-binding CsgD family transcriptional regulator